MPTNHDGIEVLPNAINTGEAGGLKKEQRIEITKPAGEELGKTTPGITLEAREEIEKADREQVGQIRQSIAGDQQGQGEKFLFGDFKKSEVNKSGQIQLNAEAQTEATQKIQTIKKKHKFSLPSLLAGGKTATEYDNKVGNFSTRTNIITLEDGRKIFAVYNYPTSRIHRAFDHFAKWASGDKMAKARSRNWKHVFEARSNVPVIDCDDPNIVLMPYLPNINAYDALANNKEISDFGPCPWAKDLQLEDKLALSEQTIDELAKIHGQGKTWGETILPNMIITSEKKVVIVDPETQYSARVPLTEQRARDLRDAICSISGALHKSEGVTDYQSTVKRLLDRYLDPAIVQELKNVVAQKPSFIQKFFRSFYETARMGIAPKEYQKVVDAIIKYRAP